MAQPPFVPSRLSRPLNLPTPAVSQRLRKPLGGQPGPPRSEPGLQPPTLPSGPGRAMGEEQRQTAIGASGAALWGEGRTAPGPGARSRRTSHVGLFLGNSAPKRVAGQGPTGERAEAGGKESTGSFSPRGERDGAECNFKRSGLGGGGRRTPLAGPLAARGLRGAFSSPPGSFA